MKVLKENKYVRDVGTEQIDMNIKQSDVPFIMTLLRNQIYSNPTQTFVREVMSNALDAHTRCGKEQIPIKVEILRDPNRFIVTDYGDSMDKNKIKEVYADLGSSDKRGSNDAIGGFGIGSASPLAYTTKFFIETKTKEEGVYHYRKYAQYIDDTEKGRLGLLEEEVSLEEETGTTITIPIKEGDFATVRKYAQYYFRYMEVKPETNLGEEKDLEHYSKLYASETWELYKVFRDRAKKGFVAVHGGIPYDIDLETVKNMCSTPDEKNLVYWMELIKMVCLVNLKFDIGTLNLSLSREELQYTPRTFTSLLESFQRFVDELRVILWRTINSKEELRANLKEFTRLLDCLKPIARSIPIFNERLFTPDHLLKGLNEKAEPVEDYLNYQGSFHSVPFHYINVTHRSTRLQEQRHTCLYWDKSFCLLILDEEKASYGRYSRPLLEQGYHRVYLVDPDFLKGHPVLEHIPTYRVSQIREQRKKNKKPPTKKQREELLVYKLHYRNERERCKGITKHCREYSLPRNPENTLYYILLDDWFHIKINNTTESLTEDDYVEISDLIKLMNLPDNSVYFIKPKDAKKIGENWVNFLDVFNKEIEKFGYTDKQNENFLREYNLWVVHRGMKHFFEDIRKNNLQKTLCYPQCLFAKFVELIESMENKFELESRRLDFLSYSKHRVQNYGYWSREMEQWVDNNTEYYEGHRLTVLAEQVKKRYPLLNVYICSYYAFDKQQGFTLQWLTEYIDAIEALKETQCQTLLS